MAAPLNKCTMIEQLGVVLVLWAKYMAAKDIHEEMISVCNFVVRCFVIRKEKIMFVLEVL